jgi:hypothetical protein
MRELSSIVALGSSGGHLAHAKEEHPHEIAFSEGISDNDPDLRTPLDAGLGSLEIDVNPYPQSGDRPGTARLQGLRCAAEELADPRRSRNACAPAIWSPAAGQLRTK